MLGWVVKLVSEQTDVPLPHLLLLLLLAGHHVDHLPDLLRAGASLHPHHALGGGRPLNLGEDTDFAFSDPKYLFSRTYE